MMFFPPFCRFLPLICLMCLVYGGCSPPVQAKQGGLLKRLQRAVYSAAVTPNTWVPALGAGITYGAGWDKPISDWASTEFPLYGSQADAKEASDTLLHLSEAGFYLTSSAAIIHGSEKLSSVGATVLLATEIGAMSVVQGTTDYLKGSVQRERPFGNNYRSFPSWHASSSYAFNTFSKRNLDYLPLSPARRKVTYYGLTALSIGTAWGRVEAKAHYPSDVLMGAAIANFVTHLFYNLFVSEDAGYDIRIEVDPAGRSTGVGISIPF